MLAVAMAAVGVLLCALGCARRSGLALAGALLCAGALRFYHLGGPSLWIDEFLTVWTVTPRALADVLGRVHRALPGTPVYYVLPWAAERLFGPGEAVLRLPSALLGLVAVALAFGLGREVSGRAAGGAAAALWVAVARVPVVTSLDARPFALAVALALAASWAWTRLLWRSRTGRAAAAYAAATALLVDTNWLMAALPAAQGLVTLGVLVSERRERADWARTALAFVGAAVLLLPALPKLGYDLAHAARYDWTRLAHPAAWRALADPALGVALLCGVAVWRRPGPARAFLAVLLLPLAGLLLLRPAWVVERYLCYEAAAAAALVAVWAAELAPRTRAAAVAAAGLLLLAPHVRPLLTLGTAKNFRTEERWRDALSALDARARPGDLVALRCGLAEEDALWRGDATLGDLVRAPLEARPYRVRSLTYTFEPAARVPVAVARFVLARDQDGYVDQVVAGLPVLRDQRFGEIRLVELGPPGSP